jgi:hypothetical protein
LDRHDDAQWERAQQSWELMVGDENAVGRPTARPCETAAASAQGTDESSRKALFRILRVKRSEREGLLAKLPGVVRRGARVDLLPLEQALREAGIPCVLRPSERGVSPDRPE